MVRPRIYVVERGNRGLCFRWKDGDHWKEKKCKSQTRRSAEREARDFEQKLLRKVAEKSGTTWQSFCVRYESEHVDHTSQGNQVKWLLVRRRFDKYLEKIGKADFVMSELNVGLLVGFRATLKQDLSPASVNSYFATLRAGLSYAAEIEVAPPMPAIKRRGREAETQAKMRGRPVTAEEFERMLEAVPDVVGKPRAAEFKKVLSMLWLGGLRRSEVLRFHTERFDCHRFVDLSSRRPIAIFYSDQKNKKIQKVAMVDDWADYVRSLSLPAGWICNPLNDRGWRIEKPLELGRYVTRFGKAAGVIVIPATEERGAKYASAQNLRQGFGHRWASLVAPVTLQHLMRHSDFQTTRQFYTNVNAEMAADDLERRAMLASKETEAESL